MTCLIEYLNNHLAGSVGAIEVIEHGIQNSQGSPIEILYADLLPRILADQESLKELIDQLGGKQSAPRKVVAWIGETISRVTRSPGASESNEVTLSQFQEIEMLALGILGKKHLWSALAVLAKTDARLQTLDYEMLTGRALEQHANVEEFRLSIANAALRSSDN
ncbi:MAG: hypothetical protein ABI613_06520 [Gemmatimonadota bacterium]